MKEVKLRIQADVKDEETMWNVYYNLCNQYPEIQKKDDGTWTYPNLDVTITAEIEDDFKDEFLRLTHHAEGLYIDTNAEYVHVEVYVDGKWYGKAE